LTSKKAGTDKNERPVLIRFTVEEYDYFLDAALKSGYRYFSHYVIDAVREKSEKAW